MGIPGFLGWLKGKYPSMVKSYNPKVDGEQKGKINDDRCDNFYIDMNEIVHSFVQIDGSSTGKSQEDIFKSICQELDHLFTMVSPRQLLYIALDGVAPRAKLHQQRSNSFLKALDNPFPYERISHLDIKPGTIFMSKLSSHLRDYIIDRMNTDKAWSSIKVILSDANVPGEGEHKIIRFICQQIVDSSTNSKPSSHVISSADSDMILLALTIHSDQFCILSRGDLLDLKVLREQLKNELGKSERVIDDWVFLCLLGGNDFLPALPSIEFYRNDMDLLTDIYRKHLRGSNNYLTENAKPILKSLNTLLKYIGEQEEKTMEARVRDSSQSANYHSPFSMDKVRELIKPDPSTRIFAPPRWIHTNKTTSSIRPVSRWYEQYYREKFNVKSHEIEKICVDVTGKYIQGLHWILQYYYHGVPSWDWYYDYYYAPLASTFACCEHSLSDFHQGTKPFSTFEQMLAIFPPQYIERMQNSALLSQAVRYFPIGCLQIMQSLPLSNIYRADAVFDPNGKHFKSQGVVKLPFVDAQLLRNALEPIRSKFTEEEQKRDAFNDDQLFVLSSNAFIEQLVSHS